MENLKCICGTNDWESNGGYFGGMSAQWYTCKNCRRPVSVIYAYSNGVAFQHRDVDGDINSFSDWVNDVLLVTFRAEGVKIERAREAVWEREWQKHLKEHPEDSEDRDVSNNVWQRVTSSPEYRRPFPPPIPANIPENMYLQLLDDGKYIPIESSQSHGLVTPPDPIRIRHDEYYLPVLADLGIGNYSLIKNEYCGARNEPWYKFRVGDAEFIVGPRKRVTSIIVNSPRPINVTLISSIAEADNTTYYADDNWQSKHPEASKIVVHAWTKDKLKDYLRLLIVSAEQECELNNKREEELLARLREKRNEHDEESNV